MQTRDAKWSYTQELQKAVEKRSCKKDLPTGAAKRNCEKGLKKGVAERSCREELQKRVAKGVKRTITTTTTTSNQKVQNDYVFELLGEACFGHRTKGIC